MALKSRVKETTATTGTGAYTLAGAAAGHRTFFAAFGNSVPIYYLVEAGAEWERGYGTLTGGTTLNRDTILGSSNGGAAVNWGAGTKDVWCDFPEELAGALHSTTFGFLVQTAIRAFTRRVMAAVSPLVMSDGDGIGGNPTVSIVSVAALKSYLGAFGLADLTDPPKAWDIPFEAGWSVIYTAQDLAVQTYREMLAGRAFTHEELVGTLLDVSAGADVIFDILKNGSTIYTTKPKFVAGAGTLTAGTLASTPTTFAASDRITFAVTQTGVATKGARMLVTMKNKLS